MKKLLSALLIATLLIASVACIFAVAEEDGDTATSPVIYNFLEVLEETDNDDVTIAFVDGAVEITVKREANTDNPIVLVEAYEGNEFNATEQTYLAADVESTNNDIDFRLHYTRNDKLADQFFTGMRTDANAGYTTSRGGADELYVVWDVTKYLTDNNKLLEGGIHQYTDFMIMKAAEGDVITINTLALVNDKDAMVVGTPLVPKATADDDNTTTDDGDDTTDETTGDETTDETTDDETTDDETTDETTDDETTDDETTDDETTDDVTTDDETTDDETTDDVTTDDETTVEETTTVESTPVESTPAESTPAASSSPETGDSNGIIIFAVLAVVALAGGIVVVRARG